MDDASGDEQSASGLRRIMCRFYDRVKTKLVRVLASASKPADCSLEKVAVVGDAVICSMGSLATPNHGPCSGPQPASLSLKWSKKTKMSQTSRDDVSLAPITLSASEKSVSASSLKPAELWRQDQSLMMQSRYLLDGGFAAKYKLKQLLGEGSFGFVWVAERLRDHQDVAVKFILRSKVPAGNWVFNSELGLVSTEVHLMKQLIHPNIIQYLDYFNDDRFLYLITELHGTSWTWPNPRLDSSRNPGLRPPGQLLQLSNSNSKDALGVPGVTRRSPCDLFECIEAHSRLSEETIKKILVQVLDAVLYLFSLGIVHRDLKDENIVVDENYHIKLIDFGSASVIPRLRTETSDAPPTQPRTTTPLEEGYFERFNGTLAFAGPEVIRSLRYRPSEAEVWSLGVLLYTMLFKKSPFPSTDAILNTHLDLPYEATPGVYDLVRQMLQKNPLKRIGLYEIHEHPFMCSSINSG